MCPPLTLPRFAGNARLQAAANNNPPMRKWERDAEAVRTLQRALKEVPRPGGLVGYPMPISFARGSPDGVYGDEIHNTVKQFQRDQGFPLKDQDGVVGRKTLCRLEAALRGSPANLAATDPVAAIRQDPDYVERRVQGVGILGLGGPFRLDLEIDPQTSMPRRSFFLDRSKFSIANDPFTGNAELALTSTIFPSEATARGAVDRSPFRRPGFVVFVHFRGPENIIFPTIMSDTTTPRLIRALRLALQDERQFAQAAQSTLIQAFFTLAGLRYAPLARPAAAAGELATLRETARVLVDQARRTSGRVVVNLAGAGEVEGAINLNNLTAQQVSNIPNLVRAGAERVGEIFQAQSVDSVVANDVVFGQVNWAATARGCFAIMRSGGRVSIAPFAGQLAEHLQTITEALRAAGFREVAIQAGRFVTAVRP